MKSKLKTSSIFISVLLLILTYLFLNPIKYTNKCNDNNIYRYKFGIYKIDTLFNKQIEYKKIGGLLEFFSIRNLKCLIDIEKEYYLKIKNKREKITKLECWKKLKCGLFINKYGELGFQNQRAIHEGMFSETYYIKKFGFNENPPLRSVIDTTTFTYLGNNYYKDKNHIYHHYEMAYGGQLYIFDEADYKTFTILGDCYAKDKNHIYEMRSGKLDTVVDYKTFKTVKDCGCFAKDKNGYYNWDNKIDKENLNEPYVKEAIQKLNK